MIDIANMLQVNYINFITPVSASAQKYYADFLLAGYVNFFPMKPSKKKYGTGGHIKAEYDNNDDMPPFPPVKYG